MGEIIINDITRNYISNYLFVKIKLLTNFPFVPKQS